jgi:hypothetical protein
MSAPRRTLSTQELRILRIALARYQAIPPYSIERQDFLNSVATLLAPYSQWSPGQIRHWFSNNKSSDISPIPCDTTAEQLSAELQALWNLVIDCFSKFDSLWTSRGLSPDPSAAQTSDISPFFLLPPDPPESSKPRAPRRIRFCSDAIETDGPRSNAAFQAALDDPTLTCDPIADGFVPLDFWSTNSYTFGDLVRTFFQKRSTAGCRFPHKLYNALMLVELDVKYYDLVGVQWLTDRIFKVDSLLFGRLLGLHALASSLFHRQGNFRSHGFVELGGSEADQLRDSCDLSDLDMDRVRLVFSPTNAFYRDCGDASITGCRWGVEPGEQ